MNYRALTIVVLVAGCISQVYTEEDAQNIAVDYIKNAPTFAFDGVEKTLQVTSVKPLDCKGCFEVTVQFSCKNVGFGNRSNAFLTAKTSSHTAAVRVEKGKVTQAIIDGIWDEMAQKSVFG